jgi:hypothetical protein
VCHLLYVLVSGPCVSSVVYVSVSVSEKPVLKSLDSYKGNLCPKLANAF